METNPIAIAALPTLAYGKLDANDPRSLAASFDSLILRALLGEQGLFSANEAEGESALTLSVLNTLLADELARAIDLGFGKALLQSKVEGEQP